MPGGFEDVRFGGHADGAQGTAQQMSATIWPLIQGAATASAHAARP
jgi:hypothetical protein